jgi:hypothetical protein
VITKRKVFIVEILREIMKIEYHPRLNYVILVATSEEDRETLTKLDPGLDGDIGRSNYMLQVGATTSRVDPGTRKRITQQIEFRIVRRKDES